MNYYLAIDIGASSGRHIIGYNENGEIKKKETVEYDPEKDMSLPAQSRRLARAERKVREATEAESAKVRSAVEKSLENLYVEALKEGRVIDANFYKASLLTLYPDWKFKGE